MTVVIPAKSAAPPRVTALAPVNERTSTPEPFVNAASPMVATCETASVSDPVPATMVLAASWAAVATVKESFKVDPIILTARLLAAVWVMEPAITVENPAFPPSVTADAPVRERTSTPETLAKALSPIVLLATTDSVSSEAPPKMESAASCEAVAMLKRSFPVPPARVRGAVYPASWVRVLLPLPATTKLTPADWAAAPSVTALAPVNERTSTPETFANAASPMVATCETASVSDPVPATMVLAASWAAVATVKESFKVDPIILTARLLAAVWVMEPAITVENPAFPPSVTADAPVRERTSTPETLAKALSPIVLLATTDSVSSEAPPKMESAASCEAVAMLKRSFPVPPARVRGAVYPASWVRVLLPLPATTKLTPADWAAAPSVTALAPVNERTSVLLTFANCVSEICATEVTRSVSDPAPPEIDEAVSCVVLATWKVDPFAPETRVSLPALAMSRLFVPEETRKSLPAPPFSVLLLPRAVMVSPVKTELIALRLVCAVALSPLPCSVASKNVVASTD